MTIGGASADLSSCSGSICSGVSWGNTSISVQVPTSAATGPVSVTANGQSATGPTFTVLPPATPAGLNATQTADGTLFVSCQVSIGASTYSFYRSTTAGTQGSLIYSGTEPYYTDAGLTDGTVYYYEVIASDNGGTSAPSGQIAASPQAPGPSAPSGLTATAGNASVSLSWTAGSGATSYNVYRGTSSGGESTTPIATGIGTTSYSNTGLTNGTTYYYRVAAVNSSGTSGMSNEASATPQTSAPAAPAGLTATAGNASVSLSWTASAGASFYNVYRGTAAGSESTKPIATGIGTTSYSNTGLTNGTAYYYRVAAVNSGGTSGMSNEASATPEPSAPAAPTGLTATAGNASVSLTWATSTGASSYSVYRGTAAGGESATPVAAGFTITAYTDTGLTNGTTYYYRVAAVNGGGTSGMSNEASATPEPSAPAAPTGLTATAGNASVSLTWAASAGASSYSVYRGTAAGSESTTPIATGVGTTSYSNTGLTNGTAYYYRVAAVNSGGTSGMSNEASATPEPSAPAAPAGLTATAGNASVSLTWATSAGASSYSVYRGTASGGESTTPIAAGPTSTAYTDTGLTNGTTYYYRVAAVNSGGTSGMSNEASATPEPSAPAAPAGLTATAGNASVSLAWATSAGASSYSVYRGTASGGESTTPIAAGLTSTAYTDTGITNGTTYYYRVAAVNGGGTSGMSNEASATPEPSAPAAPTGLTATAGNASVSLTWAASAGTGSYSVYRGTAAGGESATPIEAGLTSTAYTDAGLANGTTYYYKVAAVNGGGTSAMSNEVSGMPRPAVPPTPAGLTATPGSASVTLNWSASAGATSYNVYRATYPGTESAIPFAANVPYTSYTDSTASSGSTYYYEVAAVNSSGTSGISNEASATLVPAAPAGLTATATNASVSLSWAASAGATSYKIYRATSPGGEGITPVAMAAASSYTDPGLNAGTTYYYEVAAINSAGTSTMSAEVSATTALLAPTGLTATAGNASVLLTWAASTGARSYSVYRGMASGAETAVASGIGALTYTDSAVTNGATYYYKVAAVNSGGPSALSAEASATLAPSAPAGLTATGGNAIVSLSWTASAGAASYKVFRGTSSGGEGTSPVAGITGLSYADTGLVNGTTYYYRVAAVNGGGAGPSSVEASATPQQSAPPALTATPSGASVSLTWTASNGAISYAVYRGTTSGSEVSIVSGLAGLSYSDTAVTSGTTYYYKVAAVNANGASLMSNEALATLPPLAPANLSATGGSGSVSLSWTASAGATSYNVYRGTSSGSESAIASGIAAPSYLDTAVTGGMTYYYKVAAVNGGGSGPLSNEASATPAPLAPANLTAVGGNASVSLTWTPSTGANSYVVFRGTSAGGESTAAIASGVVAASYADNGLTNGTTYYYRVAAVNIAGTSPLSNETSAMSSGGCAPAGLTATGGDVSVVLTWNACPGATSYILYRGSASGSEIPFVTGLGGLTYTDRAVTNGVTYYYKVAAATAAGTSNLSNEASAAPLSSGPPAAPANLVAAAASGTISLSWSPSNGATSYSVYRGTSAGGESATPIAGGIANPFFTDAEVSNGTTYYYRVAAVNASGTSGLSNEVSLAFGSSVGPAVLTSLSSAFAVVGGGGFTLTVSGTGFVPGALIQWNGSARSTTFVSATQLSAGILANDIASAQTANITVTNPGNPPSAPLPFTVTSVAIVDLTPQADSSGTTAVGITLGAPAPSLVSGTIALTCQCSAANAPATYCDPAMQFAAGGTTLAFTIPQGAASATLAQGGSLQLGTVAGNIAVSMATLQIDGTSILPQSPPALTLAVPRLAPVILNGSVKIASVTNAGFTVQLTGYASTRDLTSATLSFSASAGAQLSGNTTATVPLDSAGVVWFGSNGGLANGSRFSLQIPFSLTGSSSALGGVTVALSSSVGSSATVSGTP